MDNNRGRVRVEPGAKRVRAVFGGAVVADTTRPWLVWEKPYYPTYFFPEADVRTDLLVDTGDVDRTPSRGEASVQSVRVGEREATAAVRWYRESPLADLKGTIRLDWGAMDAWFEEDEEVHVHPRDPYKRVDVLQSSRHVRVEVDGVTVAETGQPRLLFETGLPTRHYLPKTAVRLDLLTPSTTTTRCPYKGVAQYYSVVVGGRTHEDLVWTYVHPTPESALVAGYVCFYDERVDTYVDGVAQERPRTPFG